MDPGERILVIDDDEDFCNLISAALKSQGLKVQCAMSLAQSVPILSNVSPKLVLLDNNLPDGKGIDFFSSHRSLFEGCKVFMVSADPTYNLREVAVRNGIDLFFGKPIKLSEFRQMIREL